MSVKEINKQLISIGTGYLGQIKYGLSFHYSAFDFLKLKDKKRKKLEDKIKKYLFRKIS